LGKMEVRLGNVRILPKENFARFVEGLTRLGETFAPIKRPDGAHVFARVTDASAIDLGHPRTILPPKKFLFPPEMDMYHFSTEKGYTDPPEEKTSKTVLLGVHPCDIHGLLILDEVFHRNFTDPRYFARRSRLIVIGASCEPDESCFCKSMRSEYVDKGYDLFLTDIGKAYFVRLGTSVGDEIVAADAALFRPVGRDDVRAYKEAENRRAQAYRHQVELDGLPQILELEYDSDVWKETGDKCLSCGACSSVCPTCYCYDVSDKLNLDADSGVRRRRWDSCLFREHALVAGGHNFREGRDSRMKNRYFHKQVGFVDEHGRPSCVGCGRCIEACPADISIIDMIRRLREEVKV
jgi:sulfhydrogenase subunit beta (sulfur reductase)